MELVGTVVLPVAICLTYSLVINYILKPPDNFADTIPLLLLFGVLGLPAILILITTGKVIYVFWLLVYIAALPIWNFVLPTYAFWHFDDFSWGETRKVAGEGKDVGHVADGGRTLEVDAVPLRRWADWERSRLRKLKRDVKRRKDMERAYGQQVAQASDPQRMSTRWDSETASLATSGEEDRYGMQIGQYNEDAASHNPPPPGLYALDASGAPIVHNEQMAAMLDQGWDEEDEEDEELNVQTMASAVQFGRTESRQDPVGH